MKTLILHNLTHRGTVLAAGFLFSAKLLPEDEMRRRILALWQRDAKVFRIGESLVLLFSESFRVDCRRSTGLPLVKYGEILSSFPLRQNDLERFENSGETIVLSEEGNIEKYCVRDLEIENVENWFDAASFEIVETETLGEVKTKPNVVEKVKKIDLRRELEDVPPADAELSEILRTLRQKNEEIKKAKGSLTTQNGVFSAASQTIFGSFFDSLKSLFLSKSETDWRNSHESAPNQPGKLRKLFTKALFQMKLAQILGRKQAQYLAKMMEMFENGDLEEALKHAIPLEDMQALKEMSEQMPFLGFLRPRDNLQIDYGGRNAANSSVFLENQWFDNLRVLYRQTFDRLVAQKRFEEAAFVLAELLKSNHEAVEFLEKHGKFRLAAELAEARDLSKDIIVRQWFLAGEKKRAMQLAVLHDCFDYVVTKLEQEKHLQADELREIWAKSLAAGGNFPAAVNTIWKLENRRELAEIWIDKVIEFGGTAAAEMLAKKVTLLPEKFEEIKIKLLEMLSENGTEAAENRAAFADETLRLAPNSELRILARPLARKILADMAEETRRFTPENLRRLVEVSHDYALRTDLPKLTEISRRQTPETFTLEVDERDKGAVQIFDACLLPNGKIAVALGEAGVKILSKNGKTIRHFDQPTHKFVVSDFSTKAICLARRGENFRLAKIDFISGKSNYWCDAKFEIYAPTFDGNLWFLGEKDEIYAIDANAEKFEAAWRVGEIGGQIYEIARSKVQLMILILNEKGFEKWWYELPKLVLRSRNQQNWTETETENESVHSVGSFVANSVVQTVETFENHNEFRVKVFDYNMQTANFDFTDKILNLGKPHVYAKTFALSRLTENGAIISLYESPKKHIAEFVLSKSRDFSVKLDRDFLTITDEFGRVIIFDYEEKILRRNLRF